jgi:hypothetical protein
MEQKTTSQKKSQITQLLLAFFFGISFITVILVVAIFIPNPTPFQYQVFRIVLALAAAGCAAMIPGSLNIKIPNQLTAGGALAVFVLVYFTNPAQIVAKSQMRIIRAALLDESSYTKEPKGDSGFITKLEPRSNTDFRYTSPNDLRIAFLFQCEGYATKDDLQTDLETTISILNSDGKKLAETTAPMLANVKEWRTRPGIKHVGTNAIMRYLGLESSDSASTAIPFLVIIHSFEEDEIPNGDATIRILVKDGLSDQKCEKDIQIHVQRRKMASSDTLQMIKPSAALRPSLGVLSFKQP